MPGKSLIAVLAAVALVTQLADPTILAQQRAGSERGAPFVTNYSPRDYGGQSQVWCAMQDSRGLMLFCGSGGIIEFDGTTWRIIRTTAGSTVRSMGMTDDGTVFVGGVGDVGYLDADATGTMVFRSLLDQIPDEYDEFTDVWQTHTHDGLVYYTTDEYIFVWDGSEFETHTATDRWHVSTIVNDELYVRQWSVGLGKIVDGEFELVPGGERFADERVYVMMPWDDGKILFGTRTMGLLLFDGSTFERFETEADQLLEDGLIYLPGLQLGDGSIILNTVYSGAIWVDPEGRLIDVFNRESGIINDAAYGLAGDSEGDLWISTDAGISRVEIGSPFTVFDDRAGVSTQPYFVYRHEDTIYASHQGGVFEKRGDRFYDIPGMDEQSFWMTTAGQSLLVGGGQRGIFEVRNGRLELVTGDELGTLQTWYILPSSWDEDIIFAGLSGGVAVVRKSEGRWSVTSRVEFVENAITLVEEEPGVLWAGSQLGTVNKIDFPIQHGLPDLSQATVTSFAEDAGLPSTGAVTTNKVAGQLVFATSSGMYKFDTSSQRFIRDETFEFEAYSGNAVIEETSTGVVWVSLDSRIAYATPDGSGGYTWTRQPFVRLDDAQIQWLMPEDDGVTWFASLDGVIRYDPTYDAAEPAPVAALIRRVTASSDSLIFGGFSLDQSGQHVELGYDLNELEFEFSTPSFVDATKNLYSTRLAGFNTDWSEWSEDGRRSYTNLPAGDYQFLVRARNVEGIESPEAAFSFSILPPWYQTWWAYLLYVLGAGGLLFGLIRYRTSHLQERQLELEKTVKARTSEISDLLKKADQRATEMATVNEISGALVSQLEFDALLKLVGDQVQETFNADIVYVALLDKDTDIINFPYGYGEEFPALKLGQGLTSQIIETGKPLLINEDFLQKHEEIGVETVGLEAASYLGVPISERGEVVGVVSVQSTTEEGRFDEDDLRLLSTIAANVGIALENAESYRELNKTLEDLKSTQDQLVTQEKMASLGQLTAGIAHEIKNPLNFVNNFADLNKELSADLISDLNAARGKSVDEIYDDLFELATSIKMNASQIAKHGLRADSIVQNMMQHASGGSSERFRVEVNAFVDEYIGLAYHGMRAQNPDLNVTIEKEFDEKAGNAEMSPQELGRVLLNLINNALYAVNERASSSRDQDYDPTLTVSTHRRNGALEIRVGDNGTGIPDHVKERIFEPLFTTKPTGSGTGLGLSLAFDIVTQSHGGDLTVRSKEGEGTTFFVRIPA